MKFVFAKLAVTLIALAACGCSTGWPHRYDTLAPRVDARGFGKMVVVTRDQRPYVLDGERRAQYVGLVRAVYGEPWEAVTASGKPLAQDVSSAVCNGLLGRGYECLPLMSSQSDIQAEINYLVESQNPARIVYLTIDDWQSDIYTKTTLKYDLVLDVWNRRRQPMASVRVKGEDALRTVEYFNPAQNASVVVPQALQQYLELLLNNEKIRASIMMMKDIDVLGSKY